MRFFSSLVLLSFSFELCASAHAQTAPAVAPPSTYEEQAVGGRRLGGTSGQLPTSGERPSWMYAQGKWDAFRGADHHPISEEAFYRIVGRQDLRDGHARVNAPESRRACCHGFPCVDFHTWRPTWP